MERWIKLPFRVKKAILATGADIKGAFALAKGDEALLVDGFGDLGDLDNLTEYERAIKRYGKRLSIMPEVAACDLHPDYFSTKFAESYQLSAISRQLYKAQHHEAHIASAIVDNSITGNVIGIAFDGTGFGFDGNVWGGEFFVGSLKRFKRAAHFEYMPMPGGEAAVKEPWRMAASYLYHIFGKDFLKLKIDFIKKFKKKCQAPFSTIKIMIDRDINSPFTSSVGRLFDAVGSIVLCKRFALKEAELPIELEKIAASDCGGSYDFDIKSRDGESVVDASRMIKGIVKDISGGTDKTVIAAKFHNAMADIIVQTALKLRKRFDIKRIVSSGGVFQNRILTARTRELLEKNNFKVYSHLNVPTNDSGIPIGQIAIANARLRCA